ncbi:MAG: hypothetical protein RBT78_04870 [Kiritimatiellia bacterium]|nr:hypothetical protein [Kiritimatiellia bacterium]
MGLRTGKLNRVLLAIMLIFAVTRGAFAEEQKPLCPMGTGWAFVPEFSDEFNGAQLDAAKWWDFNPSWHGRKPGYFSRENVAVRDGLLRLTARVQKPEKVTVENKVRGHDKFTTASVKSKKRVR